MQSSFVQWSKHLLVIKVTCIMALKSLIPWPTVDLSNKYWGVSGKDLGELEVMLHTFHLPVHIHTSVFFTLLCIQKADLYK